MSSAPTKTRDNFADADSPAALVSTFAGSRAAAFYPSRPVELFPEYLAHYPPVYVAYHQNKAQVQNYEPSQYQIL